MLSEALTQFCEAMQSAGIRPPAQIQADGRLHRFVNDDKHWDPSAWYIFHAHDRPGGSFGDWRLGIKQQWYAPFQGLKALDYAQRPQAPKQPERPHSLEASKQAQRIWAQASPASDHLYLQRKGIKAHGIREHQGSLLIPLQKNNTIHSVQWIEGSGLKRFLKGGTVKGCYFRLGTPTKFVCVCEGYATGASLFEATGYGVFVAFHAGNLKAVAESLHQHLPESRLIICADDDQSNPANPGLRQAQEAARCVNAVVAMPDFGEHRPQGMSDFNDMHQHRGLEAVQAAIEAVIKTSPELVLPTPSALINHDTKVHLQCAADLKPEPMDWLWQGWLAAGKFHLLAGAPGTGKTTLALNLASLISRGAPWPDGSSCTSAKVLIWSGEDSVEDTLLPRLLAHGADPHRVYFIDTVIEHKRVRTFDPACDLPKLYQEALALGDVRFILIDPIVNIVAGDSHKNCEVRRALQPLVELSAHLKAAILGISHFSKGTMGRDPLERITGSLAFGALARIVWVTGKSIDPEGVTQRLLVRAKSNHGPDGDGYRYHLEQIVLEEHPGIDASQVVWGETIEGSAETLLGDPLNTALEEPSRFSEAKAFLNTLLSHGPVSKKEIDVQAKALGFKEMTLRRAKMALGITVVHEGYGKGSVWRWCLPSKMVKDPKDVIGVHSFGVEIFEHSDERLCHLARCHPSVVEGCKLPDILRHAIPEDYEALADPSVLACFAQSLKASGKIKVCSDDEQVEPSIGAE